MGSVGRGRGHDMRHEMLTAYLFCHHAQYKKGTLSQHFVTQCRTSSGEREMWGEGGWGGGEVGVREGGVGRGRGVGG